MTQEMARLFRRRRLFHALMRMEPPTQQSKTKLATEFNQHIMLRRAWLRWTREHQHQRLIETRSAMADVILRARQHRALKFDAFTVRLFSFLIDYR
jgi:hypothetical protein